MGVSSQSTCSNVTREQYLSLRSKPYNNHLYQSEVTNARGDNLVVMTYQININHSDYQTYFQKLNMMSKYISKGNIQLPLLCMTENKEECTCGQEPTSIVKIYYENYNVELAHEVRTRKRINEQFREQELWYIMYGCINAIRQFEPFAEPSGNIAIQEVLMNRKGQLRLKVALSNPFQKDRASVLDNYFAPEELEIMRKVFRQEGVLTRSMYKEYNINPNICQVYSIGVLLLVLATKCNISSIYVPPLTINENVVAFELDRLPQFGYSRLLCNLIRIMLSPYHNRPLPSQIRQTFKQFQFEIVHLQPFSYSLQGSQEPLK